MPYSPPCCDHHHSSVICPYCRIEDSRIEKKYQSKSGILYAGLDGEGSSVLIRYFEELTLPDPESALGVNIGKAEVTTVQLDETIPLSWLPVSTVIPLHQYNEDNMLVGTNLTFSNNYPGMEWKAEVTNAQGETVRIVSGTGALFSEYK